MSAFPFPFEPLTADVALPRPSSLVQTAHLSLSYPSLSSLSSCMSSFLARFPPEILDIILSHLPPVSLVALQQTCKLGLVTVRGNRLWASFLNPNNLEYLFPALRTAAATRAPLTLAQLVAAVEKPWCDGCFVAVEELSRPSGSSRCKLAAFVCLFTGRRLCRRCVENGGSASGVWRSRTTTECIGPGAPGRGGGPPDAMYRYGGKEDVATAWDAACQWGVSVSWLRRRGLTVQTVRGFYGTSRVLEGGREVVLLSMVSETLGSGTADVLGHGEVREQTRHQMVLERRRRWDGLGESAEERGRWESKVGKPRGVGDRYVPDDRYYDAIQGLLDNGDDSRKEEFEIDMDTTKKKRLRNLHLMEKTTMAIPSDYFDIFTRMFPKYMWGPAVLEARRFSTVIRLPLRASLPLFPQPDTRGPGSSTISTTMTRPHQYIPTVEKEKSSGKQPESQNKERVWIWPLQCASVRQCLCLFSGRGASSLGHVPGPANAIGTQLAAAPLPPLERDNWEKRWLDHMEKCRRRIGEWRRTSLDEGKGEAWIKWPAESSQSPQS